MGNPALKQWPFSDDILARLIQEIKKHNPKAIGLDLDRNLPVEPGYDRLVKLYRTPPNLIGIQKAIEDKFSSQIPPSPVLARECLALWQGAIQPRMLRLPINLKLTIELLLREHQGGNLNNKIDFEALIRR
ncbi:CHASE2 domain-containing protein [Argonema antarcticum]|uniref:CHASE2 domain-containing protein n=1 Tax=Argonema antarcticum TaxID=2942763 RepID=UPI0023DFFC14|nr:CHASE2 domain-containing protein [Argonema antarcticum]MCL1469606.1 CHASE2 domain-containing protein [Argonema antarcticum A004/B2]